jgi:myotubularin-related protein 3/4
VLLVLAFSLLAIAAFRSKKRIPAVCWKHPSSGTALLRSAQPLVGLLGQRCDADERYMQHVVAASTATAAAAAAAAATGSLSPLTGAGAGSAAGAAAGAGSGSSQRGTLLIVDARPLANAVAQTAMGEESL